MARQPRKGQQREERKQRRQQNPAISTEFDRVERPRAPIKPFEPLNDAQRRYASLIDANTLTFCKGPAGTGKTYVAASMAAEMLLNREVERIIITRPAIEAGEKLGFLPGELEEKMDPYLAPVREILNRRLGAGFVENALKNEKIVVRPLAFMRGHTFENAVVLLDEAQNTTPAMMYLFLTRIGNRSKVIVDGDPYQLDIQGPSGLDYAIERMRGIRSVGFCEFTNDDIVRSGLAREIVIAFQKASNDNQQYDLPGFITGKAA